jgi:hypothetical protein
LNPALTDDATFKSNVKTIADECDKFGLVVQKAQVLYAYLNKNQATVFANNCASGSRIMETKPADESSINDITETNYTIAPNPNNGLFTLYCTNENEILLITIMDISGKVVFRQSTEIKNNFSNFELNHLQKGIYFLRVNTDSKVSKLVIQ